MGAANISEFVVYLTAHFNRSPSEAMRLIADAARAIPDLSIAKFGLYVVHPGLPGH